MLLVIIRRLPVPRVPTYLTFQTEFGVATGQTTSRKQHINALSREQQLPKHATERMALPTASAWIVSTISRRPLHWTG